MENKEFLTCFLHGFNGQRNICTKIHSLIYQGCFPNWDDKNELSYLLGCILIQSCIYFS